MEMFLHTRQADSAGGERYRSVHKESKRSTQKKKQETVKKPVREREPLPSFSYEMALSKAG
jgi:hypothetical protein